VAKTVVRFVHGMSPYQAGETAGFDPATARRLIREGYATAVETEPRVDKMARPKSKRRGKRGG